MTGTVYRRPSSRLVSISVKTWLELLSRYLMGATFSVTVWQDEDGSFIAEVPSVPGCVSQGRSRTEALDNVRAAIRECLDVRREQGLPPTVATEVVEVPV
jgi:predicted RNase H-like HicB family nuclease